MTINRTTIMAGVVGFMIWSAAVSQVTAQQTSESKPQPPAVIKYDGDMANMLAILTETYGVTIGLEAAPRQPRSRVSIYLRDPTLTDVLNAIVKSAPRYKWREIDGFVEVLPAEESSPLLDVMISNFQVNEVDQVEALNQLMALPEVRNGLSAMNLTRQTTGSASTSRTKSEKFSLKLDNVTLRQALSKIASESGGRFWRFQASQDGLLSVSNAPW